MKAIKLLKKLGFNLNIIDDIELRDEIKVNIKNLLSEFYIDDVVIDFDVNDELCIVNFCRGFDKYDVSYDFVAIQNKRNNVLSFVVRPTLQNKFDDYKFGRSFTITYRQDDNQLEVYSISKHKLGLLNEKNIYMRDSVTNDLVLFSERKVYDVDDVKKYEKIYNCVGDLRKIYANGEYICQDLEPIFNELFVTSNKGNKTKKINLNNMDTGLYYFRGTIVYDLNKNVPNYMMSVKTYEFEIGTLMENFLNNYSAYTMVYDRYNMKVKSIK